MSDSSVIIDVSAADLSSEIMVIDSTFQVLARGIARVELTVPPGIYRAKAKVGDQQRELLFAVEANEPDNHKAVVLPPVEFSSPIPLQYTATSQNGQQEAVIQAFSNGAMTELGEGAEVVIVIRDPSLMYLDLNDEQLAGYARDFQGFMLSTADNSASYPLETIGALTAAQGFLVAGAKVNPGTYVLSHPLGGKERLCLPLSIPRKWAAQVFISMMPVAGGSVGCRPDFDGTAIVFDRIGAGFFPDRLDLRMLEVVRKALRRGHNIVNAKTMDAMLWGKFENPMLGLLVAHLLLLDKAPDLELARTMVTNTGWLIGENFPDLLVLSWKIERLSGTSARQDTVALIEGLKEPPMLQLGWHYLMEANRSLAGNNGMDEKISRLAGNLVSSSLWLSWLDSTEYMAAQAHVDEGKNHPKEIQKSAADRPKKNVSLEQVVLGHTSDDSVSSSEIFMDKIKDMKSYVEPSIFGAGAISTILYGARYLLGKASGWLGAKNGSRQSELPGQDSSLEKLPDEQKSPVPEVLTKANGHLENGLQGLETMTIAELFRTLVEQVDWKAVVGRLKTAAQSGDQPRSLPPLQRKLLLLLKAAREQWEEEGTLVDDPSGLPISLSDVPLHVILNELKSIVKIPKTLDKRG